MDSPVGIVHGGDGEVGAGKAAGVGLAAQERRQAGGGEGGGAGEFLAQGQARMQVFEKEERGPRFAGKAEGGMFTGPEEGNKGLHRHGRGEVREDARNKVGVGQGAAANAKAAVLPTKSLDGLEENCSLGILPFQAENGAERGKLIQGLEEGSGGVHRPVGKIDQLGGDDGHSSSRIGQWSASRKSETRQHEKGLDHGRITPIGLLKSLQVADG